MTSLLQLNVISMTILTAFTSNVSRAAPISISQQLEPIAFRVIVVEGSWQIVFPEDHFKEFKICLCSSETSSCNIKHRLVSGTLTYKVWGIQRQEMRQNVSRPSAFVCARPSLVSGNVMLACGKELLSENSCDQSQTCKFFRLNMFDIDCNAECVNLGWTDIHSIHVNEGAESAQGKCPSTGTAPNTSSSQGLIMTNSPPTSEVLWTEHPPPTSEDPVAKVTRLPETQESKGDNSSTAIGAGVGVTLSVAIVALVVGLIILRRRMHNTKRKAGPSDIHPYAYSGQENGGFVHEDAKPPLKGSFQAVGEDDSYGYTAYVMPGSIYCTIEDGKAADKMDGNDDTIEQETNIYNNTNGAKERKEILEDQSVESNASYSGYSIIRDAAISCRSKEIENSNTNSNTLEEIPINSSEYALARPEKATADDRKENLKEIGEGGRINKSVGSSENGHVYSRFNTGRSGTAVDITRSMQGTYNIGSVEFDALEASTKRGKNERINEKQTAQEQGQVYNRLDTGRLDIPTELTDSMRETYNTPTGEYDVMNDNKTWQGDQDIDQDEEREQQGTVYNRLHAGRLGEPAKMTDSMHETYNVAAVSLDDTMGSSTSQDPYSVARPVSGLDDTFDAWGNGGRDDLKGLDHVEKRPADTAQDTATESTGYETSGGPLTTDYFVLEDVPSRECDGSW